MSLSRGSVECDSSIRVEQRVQVFLVAPAAAAAVACWLRCISSHTEKHRGVHPQTVNTEELRLDGKLLAEGEWPEWTGLVSGH